MMMLLAATSPGSAPGTVSTGDPMVPTSWASPAVTLSGGNLRYDTNVENAVNMPLDMLLPSTNYQLDLIVDTIVGIGQFQVVVIDNLTTLGSVVNPGTGPHSIAFTTPADVSDLHIHMSGDPLVMIFSDFQITQV